MAVVNICGFETLKIGSATGTTKEEVYRRFGNASNTGIETFTKRTGDGSLAVTGTGSGAVIIRGIDSNGYDAFFALSTIYVRFYVLFNTLPSSISEERSIFFLNQTGMDAAGTADGLTLSVFNTSSTVRRLRLSRGFGGIIATGSTTNLTTGTWYRIEIKAECSDTGAYEVKVNGVSEFSGTGDLRNDSYAATWESIGVGSNGLFDTSVSMDCNFDDITINDSEYPGPGAIIRLNPDADGYTTDWGAGAGSATGDYTDLDEVSASGALGKDDDTTYVRTVTNTHKEAVSLESCSSKGISGAIRAAKMFAYVRDESQTTAWSIGVYYGDSSTSAFTTAADNVDANYYPKFYLFTTTNLGSALTTTLLDTYQPVVQHAQSQSRGLRCTAMGMMVDFDSSGSSSSSTTNTKAHTGRAVIRKTLSQTQTGKAFLIKVLTSSETGRARIIATLTSSITAKTSVLNQNRQTINGIANIITAITYTTTTAGRSRIQNLLTYSFQGVGRIQYSTTTTILGLSSLVKSQFAHPISDESTGLWSETPLYAKIDEVNPDDSDYIYSTLNPTNDTCEVRLNSITAPNDKTRHKLKYRFKKSGSNSIDFKIQLYDNTTLIKETTHSNISTEWVDGVITLTEGEANTISDYGNLRVKLVANTP